MKILLNIVKLIRIGMVALELFEAAKVDGVITLEEMTDGVQALLEAAGLADDIKIVLEGESNLGG